MEKPEGFKNAYYRSIPAYFNYDDNVLMGRNWLYGKLIDINVWFDVHIVGVEEFPIVVEDENQ